MSITHRLIGNKGIFLAMDGDQTLGEMVYSVADPDKIIIEHTEGFPGSEGKGVGLKLLDAAIAHAREKKLKIFPLCPFANKMMDRRKDEYADVRA
ncbi:MAG: N-acetyltransferase [Flavobacteriales bacterium]|nr:N-acetyltransferase [Flavobacteriales bacterium]